MAADLRRKQIEDYLKENTDPVSATQLAKRFAVSRQVIVGDIALMRAAGLSITATPRGYIINTDVNTEDYTFTIACSHSYEDMASELYTIVDNGGSVLNVTVEHPVYGQIVAELRVFSRYDVDLFLKNIEENNAQPLSKLTGGIHLHTIRCKDSQTKERILEALKKENILLV